MASTAQLQAYLIEAEEAYRELLLGKAVAEVRDSNGESVRYTQANVSRLRSYIAELKAQLAGKTTSPHRVMRPTWG
ncbi:gpW family head-tail joining protein [Rhizobium wenxiniae]|uniref:gpW family head-tail joining protein n=1 Tax=Rhizobium wenxiniae TaxID=1737357 RepID=UPI003C2A7D4B